MALSSSLQSQEKLARLANFVHVESQNHGPLLRYDASIGVSPNGDGRVSELKVDVRKRKSAISPLSFTILFDSLSLTSICVHPLVPQASIFDATHQNSMETCLLAVQIFDLLSRGYEGVTSARLSTTTLLNFLWLDFIS
jgi:hypothetical protein